MFWNRCLGIGILLFALMLTSGQGQADTDPYLPLKRFSQILDLVERNYVEDVTRDDLINGAIQGMLQELDPHSAYLVEEEFSEMQMDTSGEFSGVGIVLSMENSRLTVISPIEDTPAYEADIRAEDIILAIDGEPAQDITLNDAVKLIRGPIGTEVELTILHKDENTPVKVMVERAKIPLHSIKEQELESGYAYIRVTRFRENTTEELRKGLEKYSNLQGIVLDLRNNPGGLLDQAVTVADTFLEDGKIVYTKSRNAGGQMDFVARKESSDVLVPMVVLINAGSASASEIVAGALKDHSRAILLGERTFGKGSVQSVIPLSNGAGIKLTTARYYTPKGRSIQAHGITPDIYMPLIQPADGDEEENVFDHVIREQDLTNHLENRIGEGFNQDEISAETREMLAQDNQLRMGLQLVKNLKRFQKIH
ncbi:MAG: S41 family peptidase [Desulfovibrionales bacterium]